MKCNPPEPRTDGLFTKPSIEKAEPYNSKNSLDPIFPTDLLAFGVSAATVTDGGFINANPFFCYFGSKLRFEPEAVRLELNVTDDLPPKDLVTGFHVCQV
jgi:hypothetical protein